MANPAKMIYWKFLSDILPGLLTASTAGGMGLEKMRKKRLKKEKYKYDHGQSPNLDDLTKNFPVNKKSQMKQWRQAHRLAKDLKRLQQAHEKLKKLKKKKKKEPQQRKRKRILVGGWYIGSKKIKMNKLHKW